MKYRLTGDVRNENGDVVGSVDAVLTFDEPTAAGLSAPVRVSCRLLGGTGRAVDTKIRPVLVRTKLNLGGQAIASSGFSAESRPTGRAPRRP